MLTLIHCLADQGRQDSPPDKANCRNVADQVESLQALLEGLTSIAPVESSGTFTLDPLKALEKMSRFQLRSPYEYVLKLVQTAIAAGASEISIDQQGPDLTLVFDKAPFTAEQLSTLPARALHRAQGPDRHLTHLAVALNCVLALQPDSLEVISWHGPSQQGVRLALADGQEVLERLASGPAVERTRIRILGRRKISARPTGMAWAGWGERLTMRSLGDYGADFRALWDSEYSQVWRRCLLAGLPITLNSRAINRPFFGKPKSLTTMPAGRAMNIQTAELDLGFSHVYYITAPSYLPGMLAAPTSIIRKIYRSRSAFVVWFRGQATDYRWYVADPFPGPPHDWHALPQEEHPVFQTAYLPETCQFAPVPRLTIDFHPAVACHAMLAKLPPGKLSGSLGWLALVQDGVVISKTFSPRPSLEGWCIVACAQGLDTDLSQFNLLNTPAYQALLDCLEQICQQP